MVHLYSDITATPLVLLDSASARKRLQVIVSAQLQFPLFIEAGTGRIQQVLSDK